MKIILEKDKFLPPFLIMNEEGEVWQLATGEASVCWKCGQSGHIGDKCNQDVSALAASLSSSAVSQQPSWAHVVVRGARAVEQHPRPPPVPPIPPKTGVLATPVTGDVLRVSKSNLSFVRDPVLPPVRDENGAVIVFGKVMRPEDVVVRVLEKEIDRAVVRVEDETVTRVFEETVCRYLDETAVDRVEQGDEGRHLASPAGVQDVLPAGSDSGGVGAKHLKADSGSAVASSDSVSDSPPRARKVAVSFSDKSSEQFVRRESSGERFIRYKTFDIAFRDGAKYDGGKILFCFETSCAHESVNSSENIEDYFDVIGAGCMVNHACLGRVRCVLPDKMEHILKPTANGYPKKIGEFLAELGDACVVGSTFTKVDRDNLPSRNMS